MSAQPERGTPDRRRPATEAEAKALGSVVRTRILRLCYGEALTNKEIAERLGRDPASVLHHVRKLVDTGFLVALPARRGTRGSREVPYEATGKSWTLSLGDGRTGGEGGQLLQAFLEELGDVDNELPFSSRLGLKLTESDLDEFQGRMQALLDEFAARKRPPDGEWWSVFVGLHRDARGRRS